MKGSDVNTEWLERDPDALKEPVIIENPEGLGMRMPPKEFTVADVADCIGPETPLEVIGNSLSFGFIVSKKTIISRCIYSIHVPELDIRQVGRVLFFACEFP